MKQRKEKICYICKTKNQLSFGKDNYCCKKCCVVKSTNYRLRNPERFNSNRRAYYWRNRDKLLQQHHNQLDRIKDIVFDHYGGYKCFCCGEKEKSFLTIDHIKGGGYKQQKTSVSGGSRTYRWIKNNKFPDGIQILCMNCNWGKGQNFKKNGINLCPHQLSKSDELLDGKLEEEIKLLSR